MASGNSVAIPTSYACKCLNVRIVPAPSSTAPPEATRDPVYTPVFVKDDGISVIHPQVTVRIPTRGVPIPGTSRCTRYTVVTCLFCDLPVYRVLQIAPLDVEGKEATLLPTEDWVENEIMKSANGWIEVHKDSIMGDGVTQAERSTSYARLFSLLLPPTSSPPPSSPVMVPEIPVSQPAPNPEATAQAFLADMRPLYLPPPFTSSHPIFVHLASIASKESQELRGAAEQRIAEIVKAEIAGIEAKERDLKRQVEVLWKKFRENLRTVQQERSSNASSIVRSPASRTGGFVAAGLTSPVTTTSSVTIRNFVPEPIRPILSASPSAPRMSALSASLATSTFHHPRARQSQSRSPPATESSGSHGSGSSRTLSTGSGSLTLVQSTVPVEDSNVLQFKRNINDTINTNASYRYFVNLEEDMARYKRSQEEAKKKQQDEEAAKHPQQAGPSSKSTQTLGTNGKKKTKTVQTLQSPTVDETTKPEGETTPSRGRDKGKRKVTFDVEPAVVTIKSEGGNDRSQEASVDQDPRDMIFPLDDMEGEEGGVEQSSEARHTTLPLLDQPASRPLRPRKTRPQNASLIETFSSLRPSSLPNPSHIRPMRSQPGVDSSSQGMMLSLPRAPAAINRGSTTPKQTSASSSPTPMNASDAEILKLVAADTPSHRGAWTPNSKAWQTFTRRQDSKDSVGRGNIPEEREEENGEVTAVAPINVPPNVNVASDSEEDSDIEDHVQYNWLSQDSISGSVPISIVNRARARETLSLASYKPEDVLSTQMAPQRGASSPSPGRGNKVPSSTSIRRAQYAERDIARSMDPGALDFATQPDEDEDDGEFSDDEQTRAELELGERGRQQALKILQARSELPEEGMWRSLA
ncbi:hypothetical protein B0H34DRAFT_649701 [Crassisporium funariophilum]|nr:hypothetical protein B0H34DRAFT_649701 [Crassisporium funariophilum]